MKSKSPAFRMFRWGTYVVSLRNEPKPSGFGHNIKVRKLSILSIPSRGVFDILKLACSAWPTGSTQLFAGPSGGKWGGEGSRLLWPFNGSPMREGLQLMGVMFIGPMAEGCISKHSIVRGLTLEDYMMSATVFAILVPISTTNELCGMIVDHALLEACWLRGTSTNFN